MEKKTFDLIAFNRWFSADVTYQGEGIAKFSSPPAVARGLTTVRFDVEGAIEIEMQVLQFETEYEARFGFAEIFQPDGRHDNAFVPSLRNSNPCESLEINTGDGVFECHGRVGYGYSVNGEQLEQLRFSAHSGRFMRRPAEPVVYWAVPLINFTFSFASHYREIYSHPLRTWRPAPIPADLPEEEAERFRLCAFLRARLIGFNYQGRAAFIEPLPEYEERVGSLEEQRQPRVITSTMVGYVGGNSTSTDAIHSWFPFYLYPVLGLMSGREIGSPWIEWRDAEGKIVGRSHISIRCPSYDRGFASFRTGSDEQAGLLLTQAQDSPEARETWLAGVIRNLLRSAKEDLLELRAAFVFLALDHLCERFGFSSQDLAAPLDRETRTQVRSILQFTANQLRSVADLQSSDEEGAAVRKIADRASGMDQKDRAFGASVVALLHHFGFAHDVAIASRNYQEVRLDSRSWDAALSHWRGVVLHGGYFDFNSGPYDFEVIMSTCFHLHDVAVRIILKLLGYTGSYQPAVSLLPNPQLVDWVREGTSPADLGYARAYRSSF